MIGHENNKITNTCMMTPKIIEKSVIVHKDENGFGLRIKGQTPVYIEHVHEGGAAWRAGVRSLDSICKVNGIPVNQMDHKDVVLMFKSCSRFVALTLIGGGGGEQLKASSASDCPTDLMISRDVVHQRQYSIYSHLSLSDNCHRLSTRAADNLSLFMPNNNNEFESENLEVGVSTQSKTSLVLMDRTQSCKSKLPAAVKNCENNCSIVLNNKRDCSIELDEKRQVKNITSNQSEPPTLLLTQSTTTTTNNQQQEPRIVNKRIEIIRELIDTERTHIERLRCLDELFYRPLKKTGLLTSEQLRSVFSCHRTLYKIHRQIYRILLSANYDIYSEPLVGSALLEIFEGELKRRLERAACSFCSAQATNVELLAKLTRRDTKVGQLIAQISSQQMIGRLGIKDLLASCFQRLTKYPLLLSNLLKASSQVIMTSHDHDRDQSERNKRRELKLRLLANASARVKSSNSSNEDDDDDEQDDDDDEQNDEDSTDDEEVRKNSRRMLAISLAEEREFIERALDQSRRILIHANESIRVAMSRLKLKEIWRRTDKYPGVPLIDISKQQVIYEGPLTLRLARRSFDVYVLLLNDYIIILTREGQDKYRLKFFTPDGKAAAAAAAAAVAAANLNPLTGTPQMSSTTSATTQSANAGQTMPIYSPVFVIDEHLTTRDAATDENGFYLLCKRKDDSRIYEFASRSPAERAKWRDKIQSTIEHQIASINQHQNSRRQSNGSTLTKSSSEISANGLSGAAHTSMPSASATLPPATNNNQKATPNQNQATKSSTTGEPTKIVGTISYVIDDGIVLPSKMETSRVLVDQAIQVNILYGTTTSVGKGESASSSSSSSN